MQKFFGAPVVARQFGRFHLSMTDYAGGTSLPWHVHDQTYLSFVVRGRYRERLRGVARDCGAEQMIVHPAGEMHADEFSARSRCLNIEMDAEWLRSVSTRGVMLDCPAVYASAGITAIAARAGGEVRTNDALSPMIVEGIMLELLGELARERETGGAPRWLLRVRDEVASSFRRPPSLSALAAGAAVHPVHLARSFRRRFGCTVGGMIRRLRVEEAKRGIRAGLPLSDVAADAGFADQSHLARTFHAVTGMTPSEFRRAHRVQRR
jgi:AraC family transcriptional regulator